MTAEDPLETVSVVGQKYSGEILTAAAEPKSATELSEELDMPIATCYRRIDELVNAGLLEEYGTRVNTDDSQEDIYRRTVDDVYIEFGDSLSVRTEDPFDLKEKINNYFRRLQSLADEL